MYNNNYREPSSVEEYKLCTLKPIIDEHHFVPMKKKNQRCFLLVKNKFPLLRFLKMCSKLHCFLQIF